MATNSPPPNSSPSAVSPASTSTPPPPAPSTSTPPPSAPSTTSPPSAPSTTPPPSAPSTTTPPPSAPSTTPPPSASSTTTPPPSAPSTTPPPQPSSPTTSPPSQPNADPPEPTTPSAQSPPPQSPPPAHPPAAPPPAPPPAVPTAPPPAPPPAVPTAPPPVTPSVPPPQPPVASTPPPESSPPPAPTASTPPPSVSPTSSPPPSSNVNPSPPQPSNTPVSSPPPPPPSNPPVNSPPPGTSSPPESLPPPSSSEPPKSSPPPPASAPSRSSPPPPPPPQLTQPENSSPPPAPVPSNNAPPPPEITTPTPGFQPTPPSNSTPKSSAPTPMIRLSPPPPSPVSPSSPQIPTPTSDNPTVNNSRPSAPESSNSKGDSGIGAVGVVAIGVALGILALSLIGLAVWCLRKRKKEVSGLNGGYVMPSPFGSSSRSDSLFTKTQSSAPLVGSGSGTGSDFVYSPTEPGGLGNSRSWFTYEELVKATNGFSPHNLLGEGGFGSVYKGYLPDGREVAVKQLKIGGGQGEREFKAEVEIISRIHHRHLVSLVGYCISENQRLLVYDYVPNNTLYFHLHGGSRPILDWATRVKVAAGAARGIAYLHEDCHPRIIHRDIKSSNILLDNNFEARVSDFGLAKLALDAHTHITTRVMGTFGYMAPEYASSGKLTEKSDVYSFGVVLLELITGRKPVDVSQPLGEESLVEWARPLLSQALDNEEFEGLADPRLGRTYVESEMFRMIEAAAACVRHSAAKRPQMGQIVRAFDNLATSDLTNGMRVGESEVFNSAQQSAEIRLFRRMAFGSQNYSTHFFSQSSGDS